MGLRQKRMKRHLCFAACALTLSGCASSSVSSASRSPSPSPPHSSSPSPEQSARVPPVTSPSPEAAPVAKVIGFGATNADWEAHHIPTSVCSPGSCYNPDPNLPQTNGHVGIRYYAVDHSNGHVTNYQMNLVPHTPISAAKAEALQEFPPDVTVVWYQVKDTCSQMEIKSATLGAALGSPTIGDSAGYAAVEFTTLAADGTSGYTAGNINNVFLVLGSYLTPADNPGC